MGAPPSPEKVEEVLDFTDLEKEFTDLQESFEDELIEIEARMAGSRLDLPKFKQEEDGKTMQLVSHEYIRVLMKEPPLSKPLPDYSIEALSRSGFMNQQQVETVARSFRALQTAIDIQFDIIKQYRAKGYAYVEFPEERTPRGFICPLLHPGTN